MRLLRAYLVICFSLLLLILPARGQQPVPVVHGQSPVPVARGQQPRQDTLLVHFAVDKYEIRAEDSGQAARLAHDSLFKTKNIDSVQITGYTDKTGKLAHNRALSAQRAAAAGAWLRAQLGDLHAARGGSSADGDYAGDSLWLLHYASDSLWHLIPGGIAPTPALSDSENRRAVIVIHYHPDVPPPADTAVAQQHDSTQPTAVISLPINFVVDTPVPTGATQVFLPGYVNRLRQYANKRMEIDGFCNSRVPLSGPNDPLFILSVKRAKFMYDYLIDAGFDPARLTYKGMGNASPVNPDPTTRAEMDANMRVEIKIF